MKTILSIATIAFVTLVPLHAEEQKKDGKTAGAEIENTDLVESGTYQGTAYKVDPEEQEIYVKTDDGKILELYLKKNTKLTKGGEVVKFDSLKEGQKLEVQVEKKGKRLKPVSVKILE